MVSSNMGGAGWHITQMFRIDSGSSKLNTGRTSTGRKGDIREV